jgi:hypothetical protein
MDERLSAALERAEFVKSFQDQKRILLEKFKNDCVCYYAGGTFTIDISLINYASANKDLTIIVDSNNIPIELNGDDFYDHIKNQYNIAKESYYKEYKKLCKNRKVEDLFCD